MTQKISNNNTDENSLTSNNDNNVDEKKKTFKDRCKDNTLIASIFTLLSSTDVEALRILSSEIAGLEAFSAPQLSVKISKLLFWAGCINIFLEEIPQFIIQVCELFI